MKKNLILILGVCILLSSCRVIAPAPVSTQTATLPPPTETPTITSTFTITPTFTASPIPTTTRVHQGPDNILVPIIMYHRIDVSPINSQYYTPPDKFEEEIKLLRDWGYTTISTELLVKAIREGADLPPRPIIITFDDGHLNNYTTAFPIMKKYGFTGVLYIVGNYLGVEEYMTAAQIREMADAGWEVGSHSMSHNELTLLDPYHQQLEIFESKKLLEREIGVPVKTFSYPFGIANSEIVDYVISAGYIAGMALGFTHDQGISNLYMLQRRDIKGTYDVIGFSYFLPWQGDPAFLPTLTPLPTLVPTRTKIPTFTQYPTSTTAP